MCDTIGILLPAGALFAKNSDRSPNEPQVVELYPASSPTERSVRATYIEVEQAQETHALLLSRPTWGWGGEIGVNDCGVCIGNEAVFTKGSYQKSGLTGMDLLRLALERSSTAKEALQCILTMLEKYGQGGNCGYDHTFYYDNSYVILDRSEMYILETAGKRWVYKSTRRDSISNRLSIHQEGDAYSGGAAYDFANRHTDKLYTYFSGSKQREAQSAPCSGDAKDAKDLLCALRTHAPGIKEPLAEPSVRSVCMHAGGLVGDHSTNSMVIDLSETVTIWLTGCSTPCISLFKPYAFGNDPVAPVFAPDTDGATAYWLAHESFHRGVAGKSLPEAYYTERDALEYSWMQAAKGATAEELHALSIQAAAEEALFYLKWRKALPKETVGSVRVLRYWEKKNEALSKATGQATSDWY